MPEKISPYSSYGEKLVRLFAKLLFAGRAYSLSELAAMLDCSKQTVLRLLDDIRRSYGVEIEESLQGRQKFYRLRTRHNALPQLEINRQELDVLMMCRAFAEHLLGPQLLDEAGLALEKSRAGQGADASPFTVYRPGSIDYSPHEGKLLSLLKAMQAGVLAELGYKPLNAARAKRYLVMPLKIFSHNETVYLCARLAGSGQDRLFALHRLQDVSLSETNFELPRDYDFEAIYNRNFGIIKAGSFAVAIEFSGFAAAFVAERSYSPDQQIEQLPEGRIRLRFTASSEPELLAWVLSFGSDAHVMEPSWLKQRLWGELDKMTRLYAPDLAAHQGGLNLVESQGGQDEPETGRS